MLFYHTQHVIRKQKQWEEKKKRKRNDEVNEDEGGYDGFGEANNLDNVD